MKKVLIVGIDGGTFEIIKPLVLCGKLPTFKFLLENGTHGILKSTIPFLTIPAWPSFYTGKNPGKFGVFDFLTAHNFDPKERRVRSSLDVKSKSLWKILSENGKKCLVWNVPLTYPPKEINGILVGGMLSVPEKTYTYPRGISEILKKQNYEIDLDLSEYRDKDEKEITQRLKNVEERRFNLWKQFYLKNQWDFSMIVFRSSDIVCHNFWQKQSSIQEIYIHLDQILSKILNLINDDTTLLLMSDHGFSKREMTVNILAWLKKEGYLYYKETEEKDVSQKRWREIKGDVKEKSNFWQKILLKMGLDQQLSASSKTLDFIRKFTPYFIKKRVKLPTSKRAVNFQKTKAYAQLGFNFTWGVNINLQNRENYGIVSKTEYFSLRQEIISKLKNLKYLNTGERIFRFVKPREEIYHGKYIDEAPDIVFELADKKWLAVSRFDENLFAPTTWRNCAYHDENGIFLAYQKNMKSCQEIKNLKIYDIAPTVLKIFDIEKNDMDGKVIKEIFN